MREELYKLRHGSYLFLTTIDTGAETGSRQATLWFREKDSTPEDKQVRTASNWRFLRDFYFEENTYTTVRAFCQQFASDENYRTATLAGDTHWARRNALFFRNLLPLLRSSLDTPDDNYEQNARTFFYWLDRHTEQILNLPIYQHLQTIDNLHTPNALEIDPLILPAVELFNQVPGIQTRFSCQGVSGRVQFQNYSLLAVSHHEEFAYITFEPFDYFLHDSILALTLKFPSIRATSMRDKPMLQLVLRSNGDNVRFRMEARELAQRLLSHTIRTGYRTSSTPTVTSWETVCYPAFQLDSDSPTDILYTRLVWLCEPERIEETLKYVFFLNTWARASDELFYDDRQCLYTIKTTLLRQAYLSGSLRPLAYIDSTDGFKARFNRNLATCYAAEIFLDSLDLLANISEPQNEDDYTRRTRELYQYICDHSTHNHETIDKLAVAGIQQTLLDRLNTLIERASESHQPIKVADLESLFIQPTDLLDLPSHYITSWSDLDGHQLRKLDPEGYSLVTFQYKSVTADYLFHLPYRYTTDFLPENALAQLAHNTQKGREQACYHNRLLTSEESREYPPHEILHTLALVSRSLFPHKLARKKDHRFGTN